MISINLKNIGMKELDMISKLTTKLVKDGFPKGFKIKDLPVKRDLIFEFSDDYKRLFIRNFRDELISYREEIDKIEIWYVLNTCEGFLDYLITYVEEGFINDLKDINEIMDLCSKYNKINEAFMCSMKIIDIKLNKK